MKKRMKIMLICMAIIFGGIFLFKAFENFMFNRFIRANSSPTVTVSSMKVRYSPWQPKLYASGSLRALRGVNVTTELPGMVEQIYFTPGAYVQEGTVLAQLNAATEIGTLHSLQAQVELARITYVRDKAQFAVHAVSKQQLDSDYQTLRNLQGQTASQAGTVAKKTIIAPFTGRLGVNNINPGQYLNTGDKVSTLQTLDPIWADFYMPQQSLGQLKLGMPVIVTTETYPNKQFTGKVTTIEPAVAVDTRNVLVEGTIDNPTHELAPGMFVSVTVISGAPESFLTLPQTAISFNPYGNIVYLVEKKIEKGKPVLFAKETFVITGETRGEQIKILKGVKDGDEVVTSGQLKLKNGSRIAINNAIIPFDSANPPAPNEY